MQIRNLVLRTCLALLFAVPAVLRAAVPLLAADSAANYAAGEWVNGSNKGFGFQPWVLTSSAVRTFRLASSATNGNSDPNGDGDIDTDGRAWGLSAGAGIGEDAYRKFAFTVVPGMTFSIDMDNGSIAASGGTQWAIGYRGPYNGNPDNGYAHFALLASSDQPNYFYFDGTGNGITARDTGIPLTTEGLHIEWTLDSPTTYRALIRPLNGSPTVSIAGPLNYAQLPTNYFYIRDTAGGDDPASTDFYNSVSVTPEPTAVAPTVVAGCLLALPRRKRKRSA